MAYRLQLESDSSSAERDGLPIATRVRNSTPGSEKQDICLYKVPVGISVRLLTE